MQRKNDGLYKKSAVGVVDNNGLEPLPRPTASGFPLDKTKTRTKRFGLRFYA